MLDELAAGDLEPAHICNPLRKLLRHVTVLSGEIKAIDLAAQQVTISYGIRALTRELPFDYLVLALGSETNYFGIPGVAEHALGIKTLGDAVMLRAGVIAMLEGASVEPDPGRRKRMLTFVVAGGGFAGVETVGAINDLARESLPHYGRVDPREVRVVLIAGKVIALQWALDIVFERDLGQYVTQRDVESLNRLLEHRGTKAPPQNCNIVLLKIA